MRKRALVLAALVLMLGLAACGDDEEEPSTTGTTTETTSADAARGVVSVKTTEYSFDVPKQITGGLVTLELDNSRGRESHEAELTRLDPGKTLADYRTAAQQEGPPPPWVHSAGGPGPVLPGKKATYVGNLEPGTYVFGCFVPAEDGQSHIEKGMVAEVTVSGGTAGTVPEGDVTIGAKEFEFTGTEGLKAGTQTVRVENQGQQDHHWAVAALAPGKTVQDLNAFFQAAQESGGPPPGPPPFSGFPGLVGTLPPGGEATRTLELESGTTYVFMCFVPDTDGTPHVAKGMANPVTIR